MQLSWVIKMHLAFLRGMHLSVVTAGYTGPQAQFRLQGHVLENLSNHNIYYIVKLIKAFLSLPRSIVCLLKCRNNLRQTQVPKLIDFDDLQQPTYYYLQSPVEVIRER